jgi:hypothetical protein
MGIDWFKVSRASGQPVGGGGGSMASISGYGMGGGYHPYHQQPREDILRYVSPQEFDYYYRKYHQREVFRRNGEVGEWYVARAEQMPHDKGGFFEVILRQLYPYQAQQMEPVKNYQYMDQLDPRFSKAAMDFGKKKEQAPVKDEFGNIK